MISVLVLSALALIQSSQPSEADLGPVFGNTLISTYPDGRTARLWMKSGGRKSVCDLAKKCMKN